MASSIERFAAAGFRSTSVAEIARDVGVSPSAVFAYFPNKRELFNEAVDADAAGLIEDALDEVQQGEFDFDWARLFSRLIEELPNHPLARRVLAGDEGKAADRLIDLPAVARVRAGMVASLTKGQATGAARLDIDPELMAWGVEAIVMSTLIAIVQTGGEPDPMRSLGVLTLLSRAIGEPDATVYPRAKHVPTDRTPRSAGP